MTGDTDHPTEAVQDDPNPFRRALQAAEIGLWRWDLRTGTVGFSPYAAVLLGARAPSLDYAGFIAAIHADDRVVAERALRNSVAAAGHFDFDIRAAATGRWLRVRGQAFDDEDASAEVAGILVDVGLRIAAEAMKSRLAAIVASSDDAIIGKTLDGTNTDWNGGAEVIFGYTAAEAIGQKLKLLLPPGQDDEMT